MCGMARNSEVTVEGGAVRNIQVAIFCICCLIIVNSGTERNLNKFFLYLLQVNLWSFYIYYFV